MIGIKKVRQEYDQLDQVEGINLNNSASGQVTE